MTLEELMTRAAALNGRQIGAIAAQRSVVDLLGGPAPSQAALPGKPLFSKMISETVTEALPIPQAKQETKPTALTGQTTRHLVIDMLMEGPKAINLAQGHFDEHDRAYAARLTALSIEALSKCLFPGKKPEDGLRPAGNDVERDLAIAQVTGTDSALITLAMRREAALRNLQAERNQFEAAKLLATMFSVSQA